MKMDHHRHGGATHRNDWPIERQPTGIMKSTGYAKRGRIAVACAGLVVLAACAGPLPQANAQGLLQRLRQRLQDRPLLNPPEAAADRRIDSPRTTVPPLPAPLRPLRPAPGQPALAPPELEQLEQERAGVVGPLLRPDWDQRGTAGGSGRLGVVVENPAVGRGAGATRGAQVVTVNPGSPAAAVGLRAGDIIVSVNGTLIPDAPSLTSYMQRTQPGQELQIQWVRGGSLGRGSTLAAGADGLAVQPADAGPATRADGGGGPASDDSLLGGFGSMLGGLLGGRPPAATPPPTSDRNIDDGTPVDAGSAVPAPNDPVLTAPVPSDPVPSDPVPSDPVPSDPVPSDPVPSQTPLIPSIQEAGGILPPPLPAPVPDPFAEPVYEPGREPAPEPTAEAEESSAALGVPSLTAEPAPDPALEQTLRRLLQRLEGLERRLEQLEQRNGAAPAGDR